MESRKFFATKIWSYIDIPTGMRLSMLKCTDGAHAQIHVRLNAHFFLTHVHYPGFYEVLRFVTRFIMPPKKRKVNFDIEKVGREYEQIQQWFSKLKSSLDECCLSDAVDILSPDNILSLSGLKFGFRYVDNLMSILSVVPEEAGPWRSEVILLLLNTLQSPNELSAEQKDVAILLSQSIYKNGFPGYQQCYSEVFAHVLNSSRHLQSNQSNIASLLPFAGCICPPTKTCLICHEELQKNNKPCIITYYLVNGPLPFNQDAVAVD